MEFQLRLEWPLLLSAARNWRAEIPGFRIRWAGARDGN